MAFEMAERGDLSARDALLRIVQRDPDEAKRRRAEDLLRDLSVATAQQQGAVASRAST